MTDKLTKTIAIVALLTSFVVGLVVLTKTTNMNGGFGATSAGGLLAENYLPFVLYNGGYNSAKDISTTAGLYGGTLETTGNVSVSTSGTTTLSLLSTSATKGLCIPLNATSTNTLLNMTFAASSTAVTTVGVIPVIRYGACN